MTTALATLASLLYLAGYWVYNRSVLANTKTPDLIPWTIWGAMGFLNALTYRAGTGNAIMSLLNEAGAIASFVTLLIALWMGGRGRRLNRTDWIILSLGACCVIAWKIAPLFGNDFVLVAMTIGILPVWSEIRRDPSSQKLTPWVLWSSALALIMAVAIIEYKSLVELLQPGCYLALHGATALMIRPRKY